MSRNLHISAHGDFDPAGGTWIKFPFGEKVYSSDLLSIWDNKTKSRIPKLVVLSACETGHVDMVRAFSDNGCQHCIAPLHEPSWEDATVFSTMFYKLLIGEERSPRVSFKKTAFSISNALPRMSGAWSFYRWARNSQQIIIQNQKQYKSLPNEKIEVSVEKFRKKEDEFSIWRTSSTLFLLLSTLFSFCCFLRHYGISHWIRHLEINIVICL